MKKILVVVIGVLAALNTYGQGTLLFSNLGGGANAPIRDPNGTALAGAGYMAELLVGATASSVAPVGITAAFQSGGFFGVGQPAKVLTGFAGGSRPFVEVRAWEVATGATYDAAIVKATSGAFQLGAALGDPTAQPQTPPPGLVGLSSFNLIIPEPSTIALAILGGAALLLRRRK